MKTWLFPCSITKYDILGSFLKNGFVDYGTNLNVLEGDEVYVYIGKPFSAIFLKCKIRCFLSHEETINDKEFYIGDFNIEKPKTKYVRLIPIKNFLSNIDLVNSDKLKVNGIKGFAFQSELNKETIDYLKSIE